MPRFSQDLDDDHPLRPVLCRGVAAPEPQGTKEENSKLCGTDHHRHCSSGKSSRLPHSPQEAS
jgi:hypothetical protein